MSWCWSCRLGQLAVVVVSDRLEAADLAVPEPVVAEGEDLVVDRDLGVFRARRLAIRSNIARSGPPPVGIFCAASVSAQRSAG